MTARALVLALLLLLAPLASAQPIPHERCDHQSSDCPYNTFGLKVHAARKAKDMAGLVAAARYGVRLFNRKSKDIRDQSHIYDVLNALLRVRDMTPKSPADERALAEANQLLAKHFGWRKLAGKWRSPDDVREAMGWEKHGETWYPIEVWKLRGKLRKLRYEIRDRASETGFDIGRVEDAERRVAELKAKQRSLAGKKRESTSRKAKAEKELEQGKAEEAKARKALDADRTDATKRAWQAAVRRLRSAEMDIMLEEARLKDLAKLEQRLPRDIKQAKKALKKAKKALGPGYRKLAPDLRKREKLSAKLAKLQAQAEADFSDPKELEKRLRAWDAKHGKKR